MKNIARRIIQGLVYSSEMMGSETAKEIVNELLHTYKNQLDSNYWKELISSVQETKSLGVLFEKYDLKSEIHGEEPIEGKYLLESLPLIFENLHSNRNVLDEVVMKYAIRNTLHVQTCVTLELFQNFLYQMFYSNNKHKSYKILSRKCSFLLNSSNEDSVLEQFNDANFLNEPLRYIGHQNNAATILVSTMYHFMNYNSLDEALEVMVSVKESQPYSVLLVSVLHSLFSEGEIDLRGENKTLASSTIQKMEDVYGSEFTFPNFKNILTKYTINEFNRMKYVIEGKDSKDYIDDPSLDVYFEDEDQAHNEDYTETIIMMNLVYGLERGYISKNSHFLDAHKYLYNPDFLDYVDQSISGCDSSFEEYEVAYLTEKYNLEQLVPFIR